MDGCEIVTSDIHTSFSFFWGDPGGPSGPARVIFLYVDVRKRSGKDRHANRGGGKVKQVVEQMQRDASKYHSDKQRLIELN